MSVTSIPKKTTEMSAAEKRALQSKLNLMLAQAIEDVCALGYKTYDIMPDVRITNNKTRLGSASVKNDARLSRNRKKKFAGELWDKDPLFQISISTRECSNDADIRDTLYHEVIHCIPNCFNHGNAFKSAAAKVNTAYNTNVDTQKRESAENASIPCADKTDAQLRNELAKHVGETMQIRRKKFVLTGFNDRPKNCCVLMDDKGNQYVWNVRACAFGLGLE